MASRTEARFAALGSWPPPVSLETAAWEGLSEDRAGGDAGSVSALVEDHGGISVSVQASRRAALVVSDVPGDLRSWRARVDGRSVPLVRANVAYLAVPIEAGSHAVRLDHRPRGLPAGLAISLMALGVLAVLIH